jgi:hypothetical protein
MTKSRHHCSLAACGRLHHPCEHFYAADLFTWNGAYAGQFELPAMPGKGTGSEKVEDSDEEDDDFVEADVDGDDEEDADSADSDSDSDDGVNISRPTARKTSDPRPANPPLGPEQVKRFGQNCIQAQGPQYRRYEGA